MTRGYVTFKTPGQLDLKALTTFGMNAKPNTKNPIGFFGTGFKYAIAILVRNKIPVTIFTGHKQYDFYVKDIEFRDKGFGQVMYKARQGLVSRWRYVELPFTTELGKNWELWQAFRELESNTRDEGGFTFVSNEVNTNYHPGYFVEPDSSSYTDYSNTYIVVGPSEEFAEVYAKRHEIFLPDGIQEYDYNKRIQVFAKQSNHVYFRGLRVYDLDKPSLYTYNILCHQELTEDRTIKYPSLANIEIAEWVTNCEDPQVVAAIVGANPDKFYEGKLEFDYLQNTPSNTFLNIVRKKKSRSSSLLPRVSTYYTRYTTPPPDAPMETKLWYKLEQIRERGNEWLGDGDKETINTIVDYLKGQNR